MALTEAQETRSRPSFVASIGVPAAYSILVKEEVHSPMRTYPIPEPETHSPLIDCGIRREKIEILLSIHIPDLGS